MIEISIFFENIEKGSSYLFIKWETYAGVVHLLLYFCWPRLSVETLPSLKFILWIYHTLMFLYVNCRHVWRSVISWVFLPCDIKISLFLTLSKGLIASIRLSNDNFTPRWLNHRARTIRRNCARLRTLVWVNSLIRSIPLEFESMVSSRLYH